VAGVHAGAPLFFSVCAILSLSPVTSERLTRAVRARRPSRRGCEPTTQACRKARSSSSSPSGGASPKPSPPRLPLPLLRHRRLSSLLDRPSAPSRTASRRSRSRSQHLLEVRRLYKLDDNTLSAAQRSLHTYREKRERKREKGTASRWPSSRPPCAAAQRRRARRASGATGARSTC